jgi:hypothetical protein
MKPSIHSLACIYVKFQKLHFCDGMGCCALSPYTCIVDVVDSVAGSLVICVLFANIILNDKFFDLAMHFKIAFLLLLSLTQTDISFLITSFYLGKVKLSFLE